MRRRRSARCSRTHGFFTIDLGALVTGGEMQQIGAPLAGANLIRLPGDPS